MLEILEFVFQDFWHWVGSVILLSVFVGAFAGIFSFRGRCNHG